MARPNDAKRARRSLDARLAPLGSGDSFAVPSKGWVRAIRDALGMTARELGGRMGISQPSVVALEQSEREGTVRLDTLRRAADAMDCRLVYAFVPRHGLEATVRMQAEQLVDDDMQGVAQTMALEDQRASLTPEVREETIQRIANARGLWAR